MNEISMDEKKEKNGMNDVKMEGKGRRKKTVYMCIKLTS